MSVPVFEQLVALPEDAVAESIPFRLMQSHVQHLASEYEAKRLELDRTTKEADGLREMQEGFREKAFVRPLICFASSVSGERAGS
jgi:hypothetical protein